MTELDKAINLLVIKANEQPLSDHAQAIQLVLGYLEHIESELLAAEEALLESEKSFNPPALPDVSN